MNRTRVRKGTKKGNFDKRKRDERMKEDITDFQDKKLDGSNDVSWYATNPALLRDAASIPFSWATGTNLTLNNPFIDGYRVPGITALRMKPAFGFNQFSSDPLNVAAFEVYSFVRHANSGSRNYDSPDLMLYIAAVSSIYSYINNLIRIYGTAQLYSQNNRYLPDALLQVMGASPSDIRQHLADLRYGINVLIHKAASFAVPAAFTLFQRQAFMYQNVYIEGGSAKDQMYLYIPAGFFKYEEALPSDTAPADFANGALAGHLLYQRYNVASIGSTVLAPHTGSYSTLFTVENLLDYGNDLLQPIINSEDMNIMSGDILKAYGSNGIMKLNSLNTDYMIVPINNMAVLEQFKNSTVYPSVYFAGMTGAIPASTVNTYGEVGVWQDPNTGLLISTPYYNPGYSADAALNTDGWINANLATLTQNQFITTILPEATPEMVMENTRNLVTCITPYSKLGKTMNTYTKVDNATKATITSKALVAPITCGTEIPVNLIYVTLSQGTANTRNRYTVDTHEGSPVEIVTTMSAASHFVYDPIHFVYRTVESSGIYTISLTGIHHDLDNYAIVSPTVVGRLHETALLSMLNVPSIARV